MKTTGGKIKRMSNGSGGCKSCNAALFPRNLSTAGNFSGSSFLDNYFPFKVMKAALAAVLFLSVSVAGYGQTASQMTGAGTQSTVRPS